MKRGRVARAVFPPEEVAQVKAIACELPKEQGVPLSRFSRSELRRFVVERGVSEASASTIGRWLAEDAIRPWRYRSWIFPRDPDFLAKATPVLELYARRWQGKPLDPEDFVMWAICFAPPIRCGAWSCGRFTDEVFVGVGLGRHRAFQESVEQQPAVV